MNVQKLDSLALRGDPLPSGLSLPDAALFQGLRGLYLGFRAGLITQEQGRAEKAELISSHARLCTELRQYKSLVDACGAMLDDSRKLREQIRKAETELELAGLALTLSDVIAGRLSSNVTAFTDAIEICNLEGCPVPRPLSL